LKLNSDYVDADIKGDFKFSQLNGSFIDLVNAYIPSFYKLDTRQKPNSSINHQLSTINNFEYIVQLKHTEPICKLFMPNLKIADNSIINGKFNSVSNTFSFKASSPSVDFKRNKYKDIYFDAYAQNGKITLDAGCNRLFYLTVSGLII